MNIESLRQNLKFLASEINRLKGTLSLLKPESKEHSRTLKNFLALEKRYFARSSELENLENSEPEF